MAAQRQKFVLKFYSMVDAEEISKYFCKYLASKKKKTVELLWFEFLAFFVLKLQDLKGVLRLNCERIVKEEIENEVGTSSLILVVGG